MYRMSQELLERESMRRCGARWVLGICLVILSWGVFPEALQAGSWQLKASIEKGTAGINLHYPLGINYDAALERLYVADAGNNRLISYSMDWKPLKNVKMSSMI